MFWRITCEQADETAPEGAVDGRFVLHRHRDEWGAHLDLRLEQDGYLLGWRIDGMDLKAEPWATEKTPHSVRWLDQDGDAVREDAGVFVWLDRGPGRRRVLLRGREGSRVVEVHHEEGLSPSAVCAVRAALTECGADASEVGQLIEDGARARQRAMERFCGLGRELDREAFDETVWRKALSGLSLDEIHGHLRAYEVRFDRKHPPQPVSQPERLEPGEAREGRAGEVMEILRT